MSNKKRIERERQTIGHMIRIYCRDQHAQTEGLCERCAALRLYAMARLEGCVFQENKPTCVSCPVHCYKKDRRAQVREVMVYAGPRMMLEHPVLAILHLLDGKKKAPPLHRKSEPTRS